MDTEGPKSMVRYYNNGIIDTYHHNKSKLAHIPYLDIFHGRTFYNKL